MTAVWGKVRGVFRQIVDKCGKPKIHILVLGFYNRGNIGDEQYKITIPLCFSKCVDPPPAACKVSFDFVSIDDASALSVDTMYDIVLCGGGDIINAYFMEKVKRIVADFTGKVYAVSVGIPYCADVFYLDLFDHVFVRNTYDANLAIDRVGKANVTMIPDTGFLLLAPNSIDWTRKSRSTLHIGFCLATPVYQNYPELRNALPHFIKDLLQMSPGSVVKLHFFHFNSFEENINECDFESTLAIVNSLSFMSQRCCVLHKIAKPEKMIESLQQMSFNVCMRYHSIVFSLLAKVPFIVLYANKKVRTLLGDVNHPQGLSFNISDGCNWNDWRLAAKQALDSCPDHQQWSPTLHKPFTTQCASQLAHVVTRKRSRFLRIDDEHRCSGQDGQQSIKTLDQASLSVRSMLDAYFGYLYSTKEVVYGKGRLDIGSKDPLQVSRIICYAITGNIEDPCIWGLSENMRRDDFVLYEAIQYIHSHHIEEEEKCQKEPRPKDSNITYLPLCELDKRVFVTIDPFTKLHLAKNVHRSGWAFVLSHMMNLSAPHFQRPHRLVVDTYMDRTFHWGMDALLLNGVLPYRTNWVGFLHHTFDTLHSRYNCVEMFRKQPFRESLGTCKGIFVLSNYLAEQVKAALREQCLPLVDVHVLYHPTEFVTKENMFTFDKFVANPAKKVVQIGAWLRNPYAIYKLPLYDDILNPLEIKKAVLKGTNMDGYFASSSKFEKLMNLIKGDAVPATAHYTYDCVSRQNVGTMENKYISGMCDTLEEYHHSVEVITSLTNEAYDDLLSMNIVFLHLQDCSAVNTVIECIVRNTVIIVNRHPALEELLGYTYPGFYEKNSLVAASLILGDVGRLKKCYNHLKRLAKSELRIETFMKRFVDIILGISTR
jgi:hypothetical protein